MSDFKHLMLDLETMGNKSFAAIVAIAAVEFDLETGETGRSFHRNITLASALNLGLKIDASTLEWWLGQSDEARKCILVNAENITTVLDEFRLWLLGDYQVWGNGARFDMGILANAYELRGTTIPWNHSKERDVRTLVSFAPEVKKDTVFAGIPHNPVDDCLHQIKYCHGTYKKIFE